MLNFPAGYSVFQSGNISLYLPPTTINSLLILMAHSSRNRQCITLPAS
jgi:hypothetical protein